MKILKSVLLVLLLSAAAYGQTEDLGMGAFASERGPILLAVDAALVDFQINSPYVMFVFYMASKNQNKDIVVSRDTISMIYQGQEYKMATLKELRDNYKGEIHDVDFYRHLGKEGIISAWVRFYNFPQRRTSSRRSRCAARWPSMRAPCTALPGSGRKSISRTPASRRATR